MFFWYASELDASDVGPGWKLTLGSGSDLIPKEQWSYPSYVNQTLAAEGRQKMQDEDIICTSAGHQDVETRRELTSLTADHRRRC